MVESVAVRRTACLPPASASKACDARTWCALRGASRFQHARLLAPITRTHDAAAAQRYASGACSAICAGRGSACACSVAPQCAARGSVPAGGRREVRARRDAGEVVCATARCRDRLTPTSRYACAHPPRAARCFSRLIFDTFCHFFAPS